MEKRNQAYGGGHTHTLNTIEYSDWECALFGGGFNGGGFVWVPNKGCVPNKFWRLMQFLVFGNEWRKRN